MHDATGSNNNVTRATNWLEVCERNDDATGRDVQLWNIERLSNPMLNITPQSSHLNKSFNNKRVTITTLSGRLALDLGGGTFNSLHLVPNYIC